MPDNDRRWRWLDPGMMTQAFRRGGRTTLRQTRTRCRTLLEPDDLPPSGRTVGRLTWHRRIALAAGWLLLAALCGCASVSSRSTPGQTALVDQDVARLQSDLAGLSPEASADESARLARTAIDRARELARSYRAVRPAWLHNTFVNLGLRARGLCYQWADDLEQALAQLRLSTFEIHRVVARLGTYREHNALVVTGHGRSFREGLILDAWRRSGHLCWGPVSTDHYPWSPAGTPPVSAADPRP